MKTKVQNWTKMSICHRNRQPQKKFEMYLRCSNMSSTNHQLTFKPLSLTLHGVNACFIHHPSNVTNYSISHKSETGQPKKKKKKGASELHIFYTFLPILGSKIQNTHRYRNWGNFFWHLINRHLTAQQNSLAVRYSKIWNSLSRAP